MSNHSTSQFIARSLSLFRLSCYALIFGILCASLSSCSGQRSIRLRNKSIKEWSAYQWEEMKKSSADEANEWTVYSRKVRGSNFLEYKIEGNVSASPKACVSAFQQDIHHQANDSTNEKYPTYEIIHASNKDLLTYAIHKEPFPFKNTEMSVHYLFFQDSGSTAEGVQWKEAWDEDTMPPPSNKLSRVESFRGSWNFSPTSDTSCTAVNSVQFDPKKMPLWLVNPMVIKFLVEGLEKTREMTSEET